MKHEFWLAKACGLVNQNLRYIQMLLNIEKPGEQDKECSEEWLVNTDHVFSMFSNALKVAI